MIRTALVVVATAGLALVMSADPKPIKTASGLVSGAAGRSTISTRAPATGCPFGSTMRPLSEEDVFCANALDTMHSEPMTQGSSRIRSFLFMPQPLRWIFSKSKTRRAHAPALRETFASDARPNPAKRGVTHSDPEPPQPDLT